MELTRFDSSESLARAAAAGWLGEIAAAERAGRCHCVALSGGRITLKLFAAASEAAGARGVALDRGDYFWADERCVSPDHPDSNFFAAHQSFLQPMAIPEARIHRIRGESDPEFAAQQAEAELCRLAPLDPTGQPVLDLIFLGMGEDGHVASLFPSESEELMAGSTTYRVVRNSPKPPPTRVTLSYAAIAAARQVWVLASGAGKETALRESLRPGGQTPLARVLRASPHAKVFTDISFV